MKSQSMKQNSLTGSALSGCFLRTGEEEVKCPWGLGIHIIYSDRIAVKYINAKKEIFVLSVTETYKHPSGF